LNVSSQDYFIFISQNVRRIDELDFEEIKESTSVANLIFYSGFFMKILFKNHKTFKNTIFNLEKSHKGKKTKLY
jgi:hypothetical protein